MSHRLVSERLNIARHSARWNPALSSIGIIVRRMCFVIRSTARGQPGVPKAQTPAQVGVIA